MAGKTKPTGCVVAREVHVGGPEDYIRGQCTCGWLTPQVWTTIAGAEASVRSEHIDRNILLETLAIPLEPAAA